jgi:hypothetical protein
MQEHQRGIGPMKTVPVSLPAELSQPSPRPASRILRHVALNLLALVLAVAAFVAYEHFKFTGESAPALVSLAAAALLAFVPVRHVIGAVFSVEGKLMHGLHGLGGLALMGLAAGGVISGAPLMSHAAKAPFAMMGAAQALMHSNHPRNAAQAEAIRRFVTSLPEVEAVAKAGNSHSPQDAARAVSALADLITKAEALGESELDADPQFQSALAKASTRTGLSLGLDSIDHAINQLAKNPAEARQVAELRRRLAQARTLAAAK